jgi:hypothetical protein
MGIERVRTAAGSSSRSMLKYCVLREVYGDSAID